MKVSLDSSHSTYMIRAYEQGQIRVNNEIHTRSIILTPDELHMWLPRTIEELELSHLTEILALQPEVILLGTGEQLRFPAAEIHYGFQQLGFQQQRVGLEIMDTSAACRTFNILASEGRRVAAGLMIR